MSELPNVKGLKILAEVGRDSISTRYRLQGEGHRTLVLLRDPGVAKAVTAAAKRLQKSESEGMVRIEQVIQHEGLPGVVLLDEPGTDLRALPVLGELKSKLLLTRLATILAGLYQKGEAHGALLPGGATVMDDGGVQVLPPVVLPGFLLPAAGQAPEGVGSDPAYLSLSEAGRDLSALANLACYLIAGLNAVRPAGLGGFPEALRSSCSPATAQAVRILLDAAGREPSPKEALEVLQRIGWAETTSRAGSGGRLRRPVAGSTTRRNGGQEGNGQAAKSRLERIRAEEPPRSTRKVPVILGVVVLVLLGAGLLAIGFGGAMGEFWSGRPRQAASLPEPKAPIRGGESRAESREDLLAALDEPSDEELFDETAGGTDETGDEATRLADQILEDLRKKREEKKPATSKKQGYDRTLMNEGNRLLEDAKVVLAAIREGKVSPSERNAELDRAITLLEDAREKYEAFVEQFPARERLVQGSLEDANALIFFAYRQKTVRSP